MARRHVEYDDEGREVTLRGTIGDPDPPANLEETVAELRDTLRTCRSAGQHWKGRMEEAQLFVAQVVDAYGGCATNDEAAVFKRFAEKGEELIERWEYDATDSGTWEDYVGWGEE